MTLVSCQHVRMGYEKTLAVDDISFDVEAGDYLCIVGENGSGKSTLAKGLLGLMKPLSGRIVYQGVGQSQIGYLPQHTAVAKDFPASVYEVVLSGCLNRGAFPFYAKKEKDRAREQICRLGIGDIQKKSYRDLSGGQQRRVLLARALCATERLLLLDEPIAGLDPVVTGELYALIRTLNREGLTIIMISHDIPSAVKYGNKILHMDTGSVFFGTTGAYQSADVSRRLMGGAGHDILS